MGRCTLTHNNWPIAFGKVSQTFGQVDKPEKSKINETKAGNGGIPFKTV